MENNTFNRVVHIEPMYLWWMSIVNEAVIVSFFRIQNLQTSGKGCTFYKKYIKRVFFRIEHKGE